MAGNSGKKKRKIWFAKGNGDANDYVGVKVPSPWNPGKSRNKYKKT